MVSSCPRVTWHELTGALCIPSCDPRWQENLEEDRSTRLQADPLNNIKCYCQRKCYLCSQTTGVICPCFPILPLLYQEIQGNSSSKKSSSKKGMEARRLKKGEKQRPPHRESSVLAFLFLLKCLYFCPLDIVGLQGDKNGNTRPRQPGGKDAHGKLQGLLRGESVRWGVGLDSGETPVNWKWLAAALC